MISSAADGGGYSADYSMVPAAWRRSGQAPRRHLAFGCWSPGTNAKDRRAARQAFEGRAGFAWRDPGLSHEEFLRTCGESQFVISPPGNGIDCHRTWEALYMGAIPIVRRSPHTRAFAELPMVAVDDWSSLTDDALADLYAQFRRRTWNLERLFFPYWETRIRRDAAML